MSDPRFARLKTDPRFRKPRRKSHKVVLDDRFKSVFDDGGKKQKREAKGVTVDKYGRELSANHDTDNLKRFYRLEKELEIVIEEPTVRDYARGQILMDSSDEGSDQTHESDDDDGEVILGRDIRIPIKIPANEAEVDLDESQFAELDALAEVNAAAVKDDNVSRPLTGGEQTNRLAVVNLDWDHVRASHLFKIFSSVLTPSPSERERGPLKDSKGKVLKVQIYPSEFGKVRLEQERKEGPPKELFKKLDLPDDGGDNEPELVEEDNGNEYNEDALRAYQLERLRYYYAIVTCDTVETASHIYTELDGTELERSANMFDLSFVPKDMVFDSKVSDEATQELSDSYKGVEFVTDALRHSRVKLTWDDDDLERNKVTRRTLSQKEIEESDFRAYLASSASSDEGSDVNDASVAAVTKREKMRTLLLGGDDEDNELLPEGWGKDTGKAGEMEITFTPGLSGKQDGAEGEEETTLQRYLRKQKEKRKQKKKTVKADREQNEKEGGQDDEFFGEDSDDEGEEAAQAAKKNGKGKPSAIESKPPKSKHMESTPAELELLLSSADPSQEPKHFDIRSVIKAEKAGSKKQGKKNKNKGSRVNEEEAQEHFAINVKDERFEALFQDHAFAIDPTNPHFKKTKSMSALLEERAKRQRDRTKAQETYGSHYADGENNTANLENLVESVKRKSAMSEGQKGKRRKL